MWWWLLSTWSVDCTPVRLGFFLFVFYFIGPLWFLSTILFLASHGLKREKKQSRTRWRVQGHRPPFNDCIFIKKGKKKRLENLERKKNKTQVVLSSPALQVSHWNVSRSDDVVIPPHPPLWPLSTSLILLCVHLHIIKQIISQSEKSNAFD